MVFALLRLDLMFLFAIVFAMVVKPTTDDMGIVVVAGALLLLGIAVTLRGIARTPKPAASTG